jgi:hypothetical protein
MKIHPLLPALLVAVIAWLIMPSTPKPAPTNLHQKKEAVRIEKQTASAIHDTIRDTLVQVVTRWKERVVVTEADHCDSCCEVGFAYMIAYEACTTELAATDKLVLILDTIVTIDSTALVQARKEVVKEKRKGKLNAALAFIIGFFAGKL